MRLKSFAPASLAVLMASATMPAMAASKADSQMFTLDSVTFHGNARVTTEKLNSVVGLTVGDKVNRDSIVQAFQNVQDEYTKENVGGQIQPLMSTTPGHMKVTFEISEEAPAAAIVKNPTLDHETFTGNVKVPSDKLQAALTIKPGTEVTREMVVADLTALTAVYKAAQMGVTVTPKVTNLPGGHVDLNFEIVEGNPKK